MRRQPHFWWAGLAWVPVLAFAISTSRQEFLDALRQRPHLDRGAEYFRTCAVCHGPEGAGTTNGDVPRISGQYFPVLVKQLVDFRHGRRWDFRMENFADRHHLENVQAIADVAAYVSRLESTDHPGVGSGEFLEHGSGVYARLCQSCHGRSGEGDEQHLVPQISGQHYEYLRRQIYNAVDGRRPNFTSSHIRLLARLEHDDISGIADYLSRSNPEPPQPRSGRGD